MQWREKYNICLYYCVSTDTVNKRGFTDARCGGTGMENDLLNMFGVGRTS